MTQSPAAESAKNELSPHKAPRSHHIPDRFSPVRKKGGSRTIMSAHHGTISTAREIGRLRLPTSQHAVFLTPDVYEFTCAPELFRALCNDDPNEFTRESCHVPTCPVRPSTSKDTKKVEVPTTLCGTIPSLPSLPLPGKQTVRPLPARHSGKNKPQTVQFSLVSIPTISWPHHHVQVTR